jgi:glutathione S-transferase
MTRNQPALILCDVKDTGMEGLETYSPFCLKTHRALRYAGLSYERRIGRAPADFKALNPTGQVPVLLVDGAPLADSTRILRRIDALTGAFTKSLDLRERAEAWLWEEFADTALNGYLVSARWAFDENWPRLCETFFGDAPWFVRKLIAPMVRKRIVRGLVARDVWRAGREACWSRFCETLDALEVRAPERGFWVSASLSVADVALFGQLRSLQTSLTPGHSEELSKRSRLCAYLDRVDAATRGDKTLRLARSDAA